MRIIGILIAHLGAFGSGELKSLLLFLSAEMFKKPLLANSVDPDQTAPV